MNHIQGWLFIIGTASRAKKLRALLDRLPLGHVNVNEYTDGRGHVLERVVEYVPPMCPTQVLFGARESAKLYADPATRPALDAWDMELISREDLRRLCYDIEKGQYAGPIFQPGAIAA